MTQVTVEQAMQIALRHHQEQRFADAENIYRQIVQQMPAHANAIHLLGVIAGQTGRFSESIDLIAKAIAINPDDDSYHANLGNALEAAGRGADAIAAYQKAIALNPTNVEARFNLGISLAKHSRDDEAIEAYKKAADLRPDLAQAHENLGILYRKQNRSADAIAALRKATQCNPNLPAAYYHLGSVYYDEGNYEEATEALKQSVEIDPTSAVIHCDLCTSLFRLDRFEEAITAAQTAMRLDPNLARPYGEYGAVLLSQLKFDQAIAAFEAGIKLNPNDAQIRVNLAIALLLLGNFERGLAEYEWRWKLDSAAIDFPQWRGEPLEEKTIVLHAEQGIGDTIQFVRYAPLLAERGAKVIVSCQPTLMRLFSTVKGISRIIPVTDPIPLCDARCTLLSLPLAFATRLETIPSPEKYIEADEQLAQAWANKLGERKKTRVGLVWAGAPGFKNDRRRSIPLQNFAPLASLENIEFYSLQKGPAASQPSPIPGMIYLDGLEDFADTAALIANLDLVISVDTAVAHLAGAMGKPVWLLIPDIPDWRWLMGREDTPWYPSMKLFRQKTAGDWVGVIQTIKERLSSSRA